MMEAYLHGQRLLMRISAINSSNSIYGKIASGRRIQTAKDDAAGLSIAQKMKRQSNGLDMAAPGGSPILAAYSGTVVAATYSGSMGNYIMIDHGDSLYTIYMHASALYVSKGQEVTKGEKIAAVGSTGRSTGNHLHFSVRLNGNYVSPWNYLRG